TGCVTASKNPRARSCGFVAASRAGRTGAAGIPRSRSAPTRAAPSRAPAPPGGGGGRGGREPPLVPAAGVEVLRDRLRAVIGVPPEQPPVCLPLENLVGGGVERGLHHRRLGELPFAGPPPVLERHEDRQDGVHPRERIARTSGDHGRPVGVAG